MAVRLLDYLNDGRGGRVIGLYSEAYRAQNREGGFLQSLHEILRIQTCRIFTAVPGPFSMDTTALEKNYIKLFNLVFPSKIWKLFFKK